MTIWKGKTLLVAAAAASAISAQAYAQQTSPADSDVERQPAQPDDIVVTAQKRDERLLDVPVSVTALQSSALASQNLDSLRDYFSQVPGLSYNGGAGLTTLAVRGITTGRGNNPTVAVTVDDTPFGSSSFAGYGDWITADLDPALLDRVEILRGPQGTLYGANSLGGLVKYVTAAPALTRATTRFEFGAESIDHGGDAAFVRGSLGTPVIEDRLAVRISGFYRQDPGFIDNTLAGVRDSNSGRSYGGRLAITAKPVDGLSITLSALLQDLTGNDSPTEYLNPDRTPTQGDLKAALSTTVTPYSFKDRLYQAHVVAELGIGDLTAITGYGESRYLTPQDSTDRFARVLAAFGYTGDRAVLSNRIETNKFTQEVRLASRGEHAIDWLAGVFYTSESTIALQSLDAFLPTGSLDANLYTGNIPSRYHDIAGFADLTYHVTPKFDVQVGGRVSHNWQIYTETDAGPLEGGVDTYVTRFRDTAFTWLVSPRYRFSSDLMAYARVASGYRPGGPNTHVGTIPLSFGSDRTVNYEVGLKGQAFHRRVTFDADIFWVEWSNIQLGATDPNTGFIYSVNGSHARSRGIEGTARVAIWKGAAITANGAYTDARLTAGFPTAAAASLSGNAGDRLPYSAKYTGNIGAEQNVPLGGGITGYVGGLLTYNGQREAEFAPNAATPRVTVPAYTTVDLRGGARFGPIQANLFVRNVTDKRGETGATFRTPGVAASGYAVSVINPRTIGGSLSYVF